MPVYRIPINATYSGFATIDAETRDDAVIIIEDGDWENIELTDPDAPHSVLVDETEVEEEDEDDVVLEVDEEFDTEDEDDEDEEDED